MTNNCYSDPKTETLNLENPDPNNVFSSRTVRLFSTFFGFFSCMVSSDRPIEPIEVTSESDGSSSEGMNSRDIDSEHKQENRSKKLTKRNERSWVYLHSEKRACKDGEYFFCKAGNCKQRFSAKRGNTSGIGKHLEDIHRLKAPAKLTQASMLDFQTETKKATPKSFRQAFTEAVCKQYLSYSLIQQKVIQDSYVAFLNEFSTGLKKVPTFVSDKTIAADVSKMAETYVTEMSKRFKSKLSLCMDVWTAPNRMSFLGITFTYLDDDFVIQRGLLDMVHMKMKHSGYYIASLFQSSLDRYGIKKEMVGGVTQDNASNANACVDALVEEGFGREIFYGCFLHVLNLACQAAIEVYDPHRKTQVTRTRLVENFEDFSGSEDSQDEEDPDYHDEDAYTAELRDVENKSDVISKVCSFANSRQEQSLYSSTAMMVVETC